MRTIVKILAVGVLAMIAVSVSAQEAPAKNKVNKAPKGIKPENASNLQKPEEGKPISANTRVKHSDVKVSKATKPVRQAAPAEKKIQKVSAAKGKK